jgi:hypothetical protein
MVVAPVTLLGVTVVALGELTAEPLEGTLEVTVVRAVDTLRQAMEGLPQLAVMGGTHQVQRMRGRSTTLLKAKAKRQQQIPALILPLSLLRGNSIIRCTATLRVMLRRHHLQMRLVRELLWTRSSEAVFQILT